MSSNATGPSDKRPSAVVAAIAKSGSKRNLPNIGDAFNPYGMFNGIWVPESLLKYSDISASAKLLYGRLARFAGENGRCFPSIETLAAELGMTARQVQRLIGQLCSAGFLRKDAQYRQDGSQTANAYVFLYHASLAPAPVIESRDSHVPQPENGRLKLQRDKNVTPDEDVTRGATAAPPLEESPLKSDPVNSSSTSSEGTVLMAAAADANPQHFPLAAARFREFFPRTTDSVMVRILRAVLATCPDCTDEDVAAAVNIGRDQNSPGLWVHTMPGRVQAIVNDRIGSEADRSSGPEIPPCCEDPLSAWAGAKTRLKDRLTPEGFANWVQHTYELAREGEILIVAVPDVNTQGWLESEYSLEIAAAVAPLNVRYVAVDRALRVDTPKHSRAVLPGLSPELPDHAAGGIR